MRPTIITRYRVYIQCSIIVDDFRNITVFDLGKIKPDKGVRDSVVNM